MKPGGRGPAVGGGDEKMVDASLEAPVEFVREVSEIDRAEDREGGLLEEEKKLLGALRAGLGLGSGWVCGRERRSRRSCAYVRSLGGAARVER